MPTVPVSRGVKVAVGVATAGLVVALAAAILVAVAPPFVQELLYDSRSSGVPCDELPSIDAVGEALDENSDLVSDIEALGDQIAVVASSTCDAPAGRGEIVIFYPGGDDRERIERLLDGRDLGVPVSLRNA